MTTAGRTYAWISRRVSRRGVLRAGAGALMSGAGLSLFSCAGPAPSPPAAAVAASATPAVTIAAPSPGAAARAKYGGTLRLSVGTGEYPHLDVHSSNSYYLIAGGPGLAYSQLLRFKSGKDVPQPNYIAAPDVAASWEQPDETTYVFKLRAGVKYHNLPPVNGRELVAQDVVRSFERQVAEKANAGLLAGVTKTEALDRLTLRMQLNAPVADFLWGLASAGCKIVPPETWELKGDLKDGPIVGSSPFVFERAERGSLVTLTRNPDYFEKGFPYVDRLELYRIIEAQTLLGAFRSKNLDFGSTGFSATDIEGLKKQFPELITFSQNSPGGASYVMGLKADRPPFNDPRVRQAVNKGINREELIANVYQGAARIAPGITLPALDWELPEAELKRLLVYDPERARQLLREAGVAGGLSIDCPVGNYFSGAVVQAAELIAAQLQQIGITLKLRTLDGPTINDVVYNRGQYEGAFISLHAGAGSTTSSFLTNIYHSKGAQNTSAWPDPELDQMIDRQAVMARDLEGRKKLLLDIQRRIIENATYLPLMAPRTAWVAWPYVKDLNPHTLNPSPYLMEVWLEK